MTSPQNSGNSNESYKSETGQKEGHILFYDFCRFSKRASLSNFNADKFDLVLQKFEKFIFKTFENNLRKKKKSSLSFCKKLYNHRRAWKPCNVTAWRSKTPQSWRHSCVHIRRPSQEPVGYIIRQRHLTELSSKHVGRVPVTSQYIHFVLRLHGGVGASRRAECVKTLSEFGQRKTLQKNLETFQPKTLQSFARGHSCAKECREQHAAKVSRL